MASSSIKRADIARLQQAYPLYFKSDHSYDYAMVTHDIYGGSKHKAVETVFRKDIVPLLSYMQHVPWPSLWKELNTCLSSVMYHQVVRNEYMVDLVYARVMLIAALLVSIASVTGVRALDPVVAVLAQQYQAPELGALFRDMYKNTGYRGCKEEPSEDDQEVQRQDKLDAFYQQHGQLREVTHRKKQAGMSEEHVLEYPGGIHYEGEAKRNAQGITIPFGKGTLSYPDGRIFHGTFDEKNRFGTMSNLTIQGSLDEQFQFIPFVPKPMYVGMVLNTTSVERMARTNPPLFEFLTQAQERMSKTEVTSVSTWYETNAKKKRFPERLCRGLLEDYAYNVLRDNDCDAILYTVDDKKQITGLVLLQINVDGSPIFNFLFNIKLFCAKSETSRIGSFLMNLIKAMTVSYQERFKYNVPLGITLESINNAATISFYQSMHFVEDPHRAPIGLDNEQDHLIPMIWHATRSEISALLGQWESLKAKKNTYLKKCEGRRSRKRSQRSRKSRRKSHRRM